MDAIMELDALLEKIAPNDVLMPVHKGRKYPMFPHKGGRWSRRKFHEFFMDRRGTSSSDICILLQDLCIIDVDSNDLADELEAHYPLLKTVPTEQTRRGRHYWFRRSELANSRGFFDGAAQVQPLVDFKTCTRTGSAGIVICAPSTGKTWIRPLCVDNLIDIPDDLLRSVAVGHMTLEFEDNIKAFYPSKFLSNMGYFDPFLDQDIMDMTIPVPCTSDAFNALQKHQEPQSMEEIVCISNLADKLLHCDASKLTIGMLTRAMYAKDMNPEMATAILAHQSQHVLEEVVYKGPPACVPDQSYLFTRNRRFNPGHVLVSRASIDGFEDAIDPVVIRLLKKHNLVLAGGAALGVLVPDMSPGSDYDLFVYGMDEAGADALLESVRQDLPESEFKWICSANACTFVSVHETGLTIQIILCIYDLPEQVAMSFDLAPCKVGAWFSKDSKDSSKIIIKASQEFIAAVSSSSFPVRPEIWSRASIARIVKYCAKGFNVYLPGLRRSCVLPVQAPQVAGLLHIEMHWAKESRPWMCQDMISAIRRVNGSQMSGYDMDGFLYAKLARRLFYIAHSLIRKGIKWLAPATPNIILWRIRKDARQKAVFNEFPSSFDTLHSIDYAYIACIELGLYQLPRAIQFPKGSRQALDSKNAYNVLVREQKSLANTLKTELLCFQEMDVKVMQLHSDVLKTPNVDLSKINGFAKEVIAASIVCTTAMNTAKKLFTSAMAVKVLKWYGQGSMFIGMDRFINNKYADPGAILVQMLLENHGDDRMKMMKDHAVMLYDLYGAKKCIDFISFLGGASLRSGSHRI